MVQSAGVTQVVTEKREKGEIRELIDRSFVAGSEFTENGTYPGEFGFVWTDDQKAIDNEEIN